MKMENWKRNTRRERMRLKVIDWQRNKRNCAMLQANLELKKHSIANSILLFKNEDCATLMLGRAIVGQVVVKEEAKLDARPGIQWIRMDFENKKWREWTKDYVKVRGVTWERNGCSKGRKMD
jgi:hypothetical protein